MLVIHSLWCDVLLLSLWIQNNAGSDRELKNEWSTWSVCSSQCGYGISTRSHQCLKYDGNVKDSTHGSSACPGTSTQIKACNLKPCPVDQISRNQKACSEFNSKMFSGKQFTWEPVIHMNAACKMSCRAKGVHFFANLADKAEDGTPCKLGTADAICIAGVCKRIGCDQVVDSTAVKDVCGLCNGDGSSCQTISGIFTSTELKRGLNHIISIPAGSTNINITELQASRNLLIMQISNGTTFINEDTTNPRSTVVEAAGTSFTYSGKGLSIHKESIVSPGPTNTAVILKLLMRGSNPGIMYIFNVPKEVSGSIIQQIRHHSQPVEVLPEPKHDHSHHYDALGSRDEDFISSNNNPTTPTYSDVLTAEPTNEHNDEYSFQNRDINQVTDDIVTYQETTLPSYTETVSILDENNNDETSGKDGDYILSKSTNEDEIVDTHENAHSENNINERERENQEDVNLELTTEAGAISDTENNGNDETNTRLNKSNNVETLHNFHNSSNLTIINSKENVNDHKDSIGNHLSSEDELLQNSAHFSNNNNNNNISDKKQKASGIKSQGSKDIYSSQNFNENSSEHLNLNNPKTEQLEDFHTQSKMIHNISKDFENNKLNGHAHHKDNPNYRIPHYSQSFTFIDRYKDNHKSSGNNNSQILKEHNNRHQHNNYRSNVTTPSKNHNHNDQNRFSQQEINNQQSYFGDSQPKNGHRTHNVGSDNSRYDNVEKKNTAKSDETLHRNAHRVAADRYQSDVYEQHQRDIHLREREMAREERRRQIEEQRSRYNQRLKEYHDRLRQRQDDLTESRKQNQRNDHQRRTDSLNGNRRRQHHENNPFVSPRENIHTNVANGDSQGDNRRPHTQDTGNYDTSRNGHRHGHSHTERDNSHHYRDTNHFSKQNSFQHNRRDGDTNNGREITNREPTNFKNDHHNNNHQRSRGAPNHQVSSDNIPLVIQPPHHVNPDHVDGDGIRSHQAQIIPRIKPQPSRYIPDAPSHSVHNSALTGTGTQYESLSNRISGNNAASLNRQSIVTNSLGSEDTYGSNIPLNKQEAERMGQGIAYEWRISGLTECTHSCGGGVQQTVVVCVDTSTQAIVTDENCRHISKPKLTGVSCNTRPCPAEWSPGPWSACSATCGKGEQTRSVMCQSRVSPTLSMTISNSNCESQEALPSKQICNNRPCSIWRVGNWSNCSTPCGDGYRTREVQCVDQQRHVLSDDACSELMPDSEERCNFGECGKGWFFTDWPEECPAACGTGEIARKVFCADDKGSALPDSRCDTSQRPALSQPCRVSTPCGGSWFTGQWSKCDAKCGLGNKHRAVLCIKELPGSVKAIVDNVNCEESNKPIELEPCEGPACTSEWYMTSWSQCSQSCDTGYRTREVKCLDGEQKTQDDCPFQTRPKTREACNTQNCVEVQAEGNDIEENQDCVNKFTQCNIVKRARLCQYSYYKTVCCKACSQET